VFFIFIYNPVFWGVFAPQGVVTRATGGGKTRPYVGLRGCV
jgi:hypothetical protein